MIAIYALCLGEGVSAGLDFYLNPDFSKLLLVNDANPLPADYDYEGNLVTVDKKYINMYEVSNYAKRFQI